MTDPLYIKELMHLATQQLLYPVMFILAALAVYAIWCIGSIAVEGVFERRHFKASLPQLIADIDASSYSDLPAVVEASGLLRQHKVALQTLIAYGFLPEADRVALAKRLLSEAETGYTKVTSRTDLAAKVAPMIGLMGTLVPLGPGIVALGQGQTNVLASSIEIAFDTTVTGLLVAAVALLVGRWRKRWYEDYMVALEACMSAILQSAQECEDAGMGRGSKEEAERVLSELSAKRRMRPAPGNTAPKADAPYAPAAVEGTWGGGA